MKLNPELCKEGRTFKLVYYNGETAEEIESNVTGSEEGVILSFPTTRFGQFALLYTDKEETKKPDVTPKPTTPTKKPIVNTGIEDALAIYGWLFILSLMSVIGCLRIQKKHN
ncbi:MAG: hypothetical protein IJ875_00230 [Solobacterium sp.]|nr:hypothetical protein [Solobacterium sp.]